jgi:3-hydroxymyristoyl/3-hydroxydecanoyl-(acyl carrier protein) dehydratase
MSADPRTIDPDITEPLVIEVRTAVNAVELDIVVPPNLKYFRGHFPALAVLPGVAQIDWVIKYGGRYLDLKHACARTLRIKFNRLIRPDDRLVLTLAYDPARRQIEFNYADPEGPRSSGRIGLEPV